MDKSLRCNEYKMKNTDTETLLKMGFQYSRFFSNDDENAYEYTFPAYKQGSKNSIFVEIIVYQKSKRVVLECKTDNSEIYAPFYQAEIKNNNVVSVVNKKVISKLKHFSIKKVR